MYKCDSNLIPEGEIPTNIDDLVCKICSMILSDPNECENCGTPYCKDCLEEWSKKSQMCPLKCGQTLKIKPAHKFIRKMLSDLVIKCSNKDCTMVLKYNDQEFHYSNCEHTVIKCPNHDCAEEMKRKEIANHMKNCKYKLHHCEKCNEKLSDSESMQSHDCLKLLSEKMKASTEKYEKLLEINQNYEKELKKIRSKNELLVCSINYKCDMAHPLIFRANWSCSCSCCGLIKVCVRWECVTCKKKYCLDCIRLLSPDYCPNFHSFTYGNKRNFICDICGTKKLIAGNLSLHDSVCEFDLCDHCVMKLFPSKT